MRRHTLKIGYFQRFLDSECVGSVSVARLSAIRISDELQSWMKDSPGLGA